MSGAGLAGPRSARLRALLEAAFAPATVTVEDESARHAGHAGAAPGGETHYAVLVVSAAFAGMGRVARHRAANAAVAREFDAGLHALTLVLRTPDEDQTNRASRTAV